MPGDEFNVSLLRCLDIQIDVSIVYSAIDSFCGVHHHIIERRVRGSLCLDEFVGDTEYITIGCGNDGYCSFFTLQKVTPVDNESVAKDQSHNMLGAVGGTSHIFECAGLDISGITAYAADRDKFLAFGKMPQGALADTKVAPRVEVDPVDICIEIAGHCCFYKKGMMQDNAGWCGLFQLCFYVLDGWVRRYHDLSE